MKVRKLKELLKTGYIIAEYDGFICIGSSYIHDIIKINKATLNIKLDSTWRNDELNRIYDECKRLIDNGEMRDIADGNDNITEDMKKIYIWSDWDGLIETYTENTEWPNTDITGRILYSNTTFTDKNKAIKYGIDSLASSFEIRAENLDRSIKELQAQQTCLLGEAKLLTHLLKEQRKNKND